MLYVIVDGNNKPTTIMHPSMITKMWGRGARDEVVCCEVFPAREMAEEVYPQEYFASEHLPKEHQRIIKEIDFK